MNGGGRTDKTKKQTNSLTAGERINKGDRNAIGYDLTLQLFGKMTEINKIILQKIQLKLHDKVTISMIKSVTPYFVRC